MNIMQATKGDGGTAWEVSQSKVMVLSLPQRSPPPLTHSLCSEEALRSDDAPASVTVTAAALQHQ